MPGRAGLPGCAAGAWGAVLEPFRPAWARRGGPPKRPERQLIDRIRGRVRAGTRCRDVRSADRPGQTVFGLFRRWQRAGTRARSPAAAAARAGAAGLITWHVSADSTARSTSRRARPNAASNRLKRHRAVAARSGKPTVRYQATAHIAATSQWLPRNL